MKIPFQYQLTASYARVTNKKILPQSKMSSSMVRLISAICVTVLILSLAGLSEANYKNAPMNGIMFGKRGPLDYDSRVKTFTSLCEIASEACQVWFPPQENK